MLINDPGNEVRFLLNSNVVLMVSIILVNTLNSHTSIREPLNKKPKPKKALTIWHAYQ